MELDPEAPLSPAETKSVIDPGSNVVVSVRAQGDGQLPTKGLIIRFGTLNLMLDGGTTDLIGIDGLFSKPRAGSRVQKLIDSLEKVGEAEQTIRLPSKELRPMGDKKKLW